MRTIIRATSTPSTWERTSSPPGDGALVRDIDVGNQATRERDPVPPREPREHNMTTRHLRDISKIHIF
jgi:hypothetical protein